MLPRVHVKSPKDFWAGLMFIAFGLFFLFAASNYRMGTAMRMGPAYFPSILGGLMAVLGAVILLQSLVVKGGKVPPISFRPLFLVSLSLLLFGYLIQPIGMALALILLVVVAASAGHEFKLKEVLIMAVVATFFSILIFVKLLGLPYQLWPGFLG
ncbi:MAG: tripartite tricarboxylate transporter TctB family protein [Deltaproteobacteria bacterium]|nr:tripartite tricarboxylate transporter TctB family protein [Deltaproteobacteria bacterium]